MEAWGGRAVGAGHIAYRRGATWWGRRAVHREAWRDSRQLGLGLELISSCWGWCWGCGWNGGGVWADQRGQGKVAGAGPGDANWARPPNASMGVVGGARVEGIWWWW